MAREDEMPERLQDLSEFDDISTIVGKMSPRAREGSRVYDRLGDGEGGGAVLDTAAFTAEIVLDLRPQITDHEKPLEFLYF